MTRIPTVISLDARVFREYHPRSRSRILIRDTKHNEPYRCVQFMFPDVATNFAPKYAWLNKRSSHLIMAKGRYARRNALPCSFLELQQRPLHSVALVRGIVQGATVPFEELADVVETLKQSGEVHEFGYFMHRVHYTKGGSVRQRGWNDAADPHAVVIPIYKR